MKKEMFSAVVVYNRHRWSVHNEQGEQPKREDGEAGSGDTTESTRGAVRQACTAVVRTRGHSD